MADQPDGSLIQCRLGFSIRLADGWRAVDEVEADEDLAAEATARFERWFSSWSSGLSGEARELVTWADKAGTAHLVGLLQGLEPTGLAPINLYGAEAAAVPTYADPEASRAARALLLVSQAEQQRQDARRAEPLGRLVGYFRAESAGEPGSPELEVSRYQFKQPLDALSFYQAAKPSPWDLARGNRPNRFYSIDGMDAVRFYCQWAVDLDRKAVCYYAADNQEGWQVDCWADQRHFERLKPVLIKICESLRRSA